MKQIINAKGTVVYEGQVKYLWVAQCKCGIKLVRSLSEAGLSMYICSDKFRCKECGERLQKQGQLHFKGDEMLNKEQVMAATDF